MYAPNDNKAGARRADAVPKSLYAPIYLGSAQQFRVRSPHDICKMGGVLAPPFCKCHLVVGLTFGCKVRRASRIEMRLLGTLLSE